MYRGPVRNRTIFEVISTKVSVNNYLHLIPPTPGWRVRIYDPTKYKHGPITRDVVAFALRRDGAVVALIGTENGIEEVPTPTAFCDIYLLGPSDESICVSPPAEPIASHPITETEGISPIASKVLRFIAEARLTPVPYEVLVETFSEINANIAITELIIRSLIKNDGEELWSYHATDRGKSHAKRISNQDALAGRA
jgi:hypothetical protein